MNTTQILEYGVREYGPLIIFALILVGALLLNTIITRRNVDNWWQFHAHEFAADKAQKMIERRDEKIKALEGRVRELNRERRSLVDTVRAAATFSDRTREILTQPEVIRLRGMADTEPEYRIKKRRDA